jgi:formate-dependent nitrite reductase membrane component NrfD
MKALLSADAPARPSAVLHRLRVHLTVARTHEFRKHYSMRSRECQSAAYVTDLALVNVDYVSPSLWLGVLVATSGLVLYSYKMSDARGTKDVETVTASLLVLAGGILAVQGWRLDPILMLSEGVLASVGIFYIIQTVELRKQVLV